MPITSDGVSVSYTHLDVYKRQHVRTVRQVHAVHIGVDGFQDECDWHRSDVCTRIWRREGHDTLHLAIWSDATAFVTNKSLAMPTDIDTMAGPVSYTHLDVYKRQV